MLRALDGLACESGQGTFGPAVELDDEGSGPRACVHDTRRAERVAVVAQSLAEVAASPADDLDIAASSVLRPGHRAPRGSGD